MSDHIISDWANDGPPPPPRRGLCLGIILVFLVGLVLLALLIRGIVAEAPFQ